MTVELAAIGIVVRQAGADRNDQIGFCKAFPREVARKPSGDTEIERVVVE